MHNFRIDSRRVKRKAASGCWMRTPAWAELLHANSAAENHRLACPRWHSPAGRWIAPTSSSRASYLPRTPYDGLA
jgi:hypothetical protein